MDESAVSDSFDELFITHYSRLARLLCRVTGDTATAEDLASEAFFRLHQRPPSSRHNLPGWLCRTACGWPSTA
jgi:DNA-directed RNA polymerase specialized sigma24 family protein